MHIRTPTDKNKDYFGCVLVNDLIDSSKNKTLTNVEFVELNDKINEAFGSNDHFIVGKGSKNIKIECKFLKCLYSQWFFFKTDKNGNISNIRYNRGINKNHSLNAHEKGDIRPAYEE